MRGARVSDDDAKTGTDSAKDEDVLVVGGPSDSGEGYDVLRKRKDRLEVGELRNTREGRPIHGELVKLSPRGESKRVFDVEVLVPKPEQRAEGAGPAQVATNAYRKNWDRVFGKAKPN